MPFNKHSIIILAITFVVYLLIVELGLFPMNMVTSIIIRLGYYTWIIMYLLHKLNPNRLFSVPIIIFTALVLFTIIALILSIDAFMMVVYMLMFFSWFIISMIMFVIFRRLYYYNQLIKYKNKDK